MWPAAWPARREAGPGPVRHHGRMSSLGPDGLFGALFAAGRVAIDDDQWLQAILDVEAALARALERAGLAPAGAGGAVTEAARAGRFDATELGRQAALTGN